MGNKFIYLLVIFVGIFIFSFRFIDDDPFYVITKKDIQLNLPKHFPKPTYSFKNNKITPEGFVLGRKLFYDPILSKDSTVSCASCHQQYVAFAHIDHALSHGIEDRIGIRNVGALQNLIWNTSFMWDGGINHIEIQPIAPITNKVEMAEDLGNVLLKLNRNKSYKKAFKQVFKDSIISSQNLLKSLTQFMGLLISSNSKYDKFISGKTDFSIEEKKGLDLFRQKCASCHTEPLFTNNTFISNGLLPNIKINDKGRYTITGVESDLYKFKVPSLRNVELTLPYMHDGRFRNLNEVLNFYSNPKQHSRYADILLADIGVLTTEEKNCIILFLKTLTDKEFLYDRRFADPNFVRN